MYISIPTSTPNGPQIDPKSKPKSSENRPKIDPKSKPNRPQIAPKPDLRPAIDFEAFFGSILRRLGSSWWPSGPLLRASWSRLGASSGVLEPSWDDLGAILGRLGAVLGRLGSHLEPFWTPRGPRCRNLRFSLGFCWFLRPRRGPPLLVRWMWRDVRGGCMGGNIIM